MQGIARSAKLERIGQLPRGREGLGGLGEKGKLGGSQRRRVAEERDRDRITAVFRSDEQRRLRGTAGTRRDAREGLQQSLQVSAKPVNP